MKMTRERKWLGAILGLGVGALVLDQTLMGAPESANANEGAELVDSSTGDLVVPQDERAPLSLQETADETDLSDFALRLEATGELMQGDDDVRDAFAIPEHWVSQVTDTRPNNQTPGDIASDAKTFLSSHILVGTIVSATGNYAVLEGEQAPINVRIGQVVDGFELRAVEDRATGWISQSSGERAILRVTLPDTP